MSLPANPTHSPLFPAPSMLSLRGKLMALQSRTGSQLLSLPHSLPATTRPSAPAPELELHATGQGHVVGVSGDTASLLLGFGGRLSRLRGHTSQGSHHGTSRPHESEGSSGIMPGSPPWTLHPTHSGDLHKYSVRPGRHFGEDGIEWASWVSF